jgi:beta-galactosidase/beta-glucuronidase
MYNISINIKKIQVPIIKINNPSLWYPRTLLNNSTNYPYLYKLVVKILDNENKLNNIRKEKN